MDRKKHMGQDIYERYAEQITKASINSKGESTMVGETVLYFANIYSKEIEDRTRESEAKIYIPQINKLTEEIEALKARLALYENN